MPALPEARQILGDLMEAMLKHQHPEALILCTQQEQARCTLSLPQGNLQGMGAALEV